MLPQARREHLSIHELAEETLVTDLQSHKVHALNGVAALIWRHCDGKTSVPELARLLPAELQVKGAEDVVQLALQQLGRRHLLMEAPPPLSGAARLSRRDALKKLAVVAFALPVVMTVTARSANASVAVSKQCPSGSTYCSGIAPHIICCTGNEVCTSGVCGPKPQSGATTPCLPVGNACTKGQICCGVAGGKNYVCPPGGTC